LEDLLGQMMGGGQSAQPGDDSQSQSSGSDSPLGKIFGDLARGGFSGDDNEPDPADQHHEPEPRQPRSSGNGGLGDLFGEMFDTGREVQDNYQRNVDSIFDQYLKGMK